MFSITNFILYIIQKVFRKNILVMTILIIVSWSFIFSSYIAIHSMCKYSCIHCTMRIVSLNKMASGCRTSSWYCEWILSAIWSFFSSICPMRMIFKKIYLGLDNMYPKYNIFRCFITSNNMLARNKTYMPLFIGYVFCSGDS